MSSFDTFASDLPDDFDLVPGRTWFGVNEESERDDIYLHIEGIAHFEDGTEEEMDLLIKTGKNWEPTKGGKEVKHKGGRKVFSRSSHMANVLAAIGELDNADEALATLIEAGGGPDGATKAAAYSTAVFHWNRREFKGGINRETGEPMVWEWPMPTAYLGTVDEYQSGGKSKTKKKATKATKSKKAKANKNGDLRDAVVAFAENYDDFDEFVTDVFDEDEFPRADELFEDEGLKAEVEDEEGLWTEVHG